MKNVLLLFLIFLVIFCCIPDDSVAWTLTLFVDGVVSGTPSTSAYPVEWSNVHASNSTMYMAYDGDHFFDGQIDEVNSFLTLIGRRVSLIRQRWYGTL